MVAKEFNASIATIHLENEYLMKCIFIFFHFVAPLVDDCFRVSITLGGSVAERFKSISH